MPLPVLDGERKLLLSRIVVQSQDLAHAFFLEHARANALVQLKQRHGVMRRVRGAHPTGIDIFGTVIRTEPHLNGAVSGRQRAVAFVPELVRLRPAGARRRLEEEPDAVRPAAPQGEVVRAPAHPRREEPVIPFRERQRLGRTDFETRDLQRRQQDRLVLDRMSVVVERRRERTQLKRRPQPLRARVHVPLVHVQRRLLGRAHVRRPANIAERLRQHVPVAVQLLDLHDAAPDELRAARDLDLLHHALARQRLRNRNFEGGVGPVFRALQKKALLRFLDRSALKPPAGRARQRPGEETTIRLADLHAVRARFARQRLRALRHREPEPHRPRLLSVQRLHGKRLAVGTHLEPVAFAHEAHPDQFPGQDLDLARNGRVVRRVPFQRKHGRRHRHDSGQQDGHHETT